MRRWIALTAAALALTGCGREIRTTTYADGQLWSQVLYKGGVPDGVWRTFWENGQPKSEGSYKEGTVHGTWQTWFEDGTPWSTQRFSEGKPQGQ